MLNSTTYSSECYPASLQSEDLNDADLFDYQEEEENASAQSRKYPDELSVLVLRNTTLYPGVVIPITVARDKSIQLVKEAYNSGNRIIGVVAQKNVKVEAPGKEDVFLTGTVAHINRLIKMPDGSVTTVIQGKERFHIEDFTQEDPYFRATYKLTPEKNPPPAKAKAMMLSLKNEASRIIELSPNIPTEANITLHNINNLNFLVHFIASNLNAELAEKQALLEIDNLMEKANKVLELLSKELQVLEISEEIQSKVKHDLDKQQRDYILRQQIKAMQDELGEKSVESEIEAFKKRAETKNWTVEVAEAFYKELNKLTRTMSNSPEYGVITNYVDWMLDLPWGEYTEDRFDLKAAREVLDRDHFGMEKVKERIIEYLAVLKLKSDMKAPILCFYGPPGVGKTSLGKSIANSLNRNFVRISLGGVRDEAEIRGHRRTYIGAMPGRIVQGLKKAKSNNPVFILDEIDKVGNDWRGDPGSALLEVLDPEQNSTFNDHYMEVDLDLSTIMFIATANALDTIHPALRDRMEIVEINGYTLQEKIQIAQTHLLPRIQEEHGIEPEQMKISPKEISSVIEGYTRESGVRNLSQKLASLCRGAAKDIVEHENDAVEIDEETVARYLGARRFENELYHKVNKPGVAIGLAWTQTGGEILFIETALLPGSGKLSLTGQLGEVMKESAHVAYIYLKANADKFGVPENVFKNWDVHLHIPAGAIPKDGPSAGTAILSALASAFSQRMLKSKLAMTGEITLRGKVLPVGGIKEKILAAARAGIETILLCKINEKDVNEINPDHIEKLDIHYVETLDDVLELALEKEQIEHPIKLEREHGESEPNVPRQDKEQEVVTVEV